ncbi:MAG: DUF2079 domain-containing protein [Patescibacteria group bacterium]
MRILETFKKNLLFWAMMLFFFTSYIILILGKHRLFQTGEDLAIYCQACWHYSNFRVPFVTVWIDTNILNDHFGPIMVLLAQLFHLWTDPRILLIAQQIIVVSGAIPIYFYAKATLKNQYYSLLFAFLYLYFIGIQSALSSDFHLAAITAGILSFSLYFCLTDKWKFYWPSIFLLLLTKEDTPVLISALGLYLVIFKRRSKYGLITIFISLAYYLLIYSLFLPIINSNQVFLYQGAGKANRIVNILIYSPGEFFKTFVWPPVKLRNIALCLWSFGFLPVASPIFWIIAPTNLLRFFSDEARYSLHYQYSATLTPILAFAAIGVFAKCSWLKTVFLFLAIIGTLSSTCFFRQSSSFSFFFQTVSF